MAETWTYGSWGSFRIDSTVAELLLRLRIAMLTAMES